MELYERAAALRPADFALRSQYAVAMSASGDSEGARIEFASLKQLLPGTAQPLLDALSGAAAVEPSLHDRLAEVMEVPTLVRNDECAWMDCAALTGGRADGCAEGYCLCAPTHHGLRCEQTFERDAIADAAAGGELSSEHEYLLTAGFQLKQRLGATVVQQSDFVLEVAGGYKSIAEHLTAAGAGLHLHHNVEPVVRGSERMTASGWRSVDIPVLFEDFRLPAIIGSSSLVLLGFTPTSRSYCHSVLDALQTGGWEKIVLEAPLKGDLLGMSAIASSMLALQTTGEYSLSQRLRLDPCEGLDPLTTLDSQHHATRPHQTKRLPSGLHPPDCERFVYILTRRPETADEAQQALRCAIDGQEFVQFFRDLIALAGSSPSASDAASICAVIEEEEQVEEISVAEHVAQMLALSEAMHPLAVPTATHGDLGPLEAVTKMLAENIAGAESIEIRVGRSGVSQGSCNAGASVL